MHELEELGIDSLIFKGEKQVLGVPVLGKGCVGIVALARLDHERAALKIRRTDADRSRMEREARLLKKANSVGVGPELLAVTKNFLLMQFIEGDLLPEWLRKHPDNARIRKVLRDVMEQCCRLDKVSLDHGELSHAPKHIIISKRDKPSIVDFESSSLNRNPSNVTSICQFLFIGSETARRIAERLDEKDKATIVMALRCYKTKRTVENFERILMDCGL
jgi:putative serine/threonine protein kinase